MNVKMANVKMAAIGIVMCCMLAGCLPSASNTPSSQKESVYERVTRTGTIRCGYFVEAPFTMRDESTGEMSGLAVDLTKMLAKELNLELEWAEEMSFATLGQDLNNNRYDMVCGGLFILPRAGIMDYVDPFSYVSVHGYVRPENTNFDKNFEDINWKDVKIAGLDGEGATKAALKLLPEAHMEILPQLSNISEMLMLVSTGKADIGFVLPSVFEEFNTTNPNTLRKAKLNKPLYSYAMSFGIARGQEEFKAMMNNALLQVSTSGELDALFKVYDPNGYFKAPSQ